MFEYNVIFKISLFYLLSNHFKLHKLLKFVLHLFKTIYTLARQYTYTVFRFYTYCFFFR